MDSIHDADNDCVDRTTPIENLTGTITLLHDEDAITWTCAHLIECYDALGAPTAASSNLTTIIFFAS